MIYLSFFFQENKIISIHTLTHTIKSTFSMHENKLSFNGKMKNQQIRFNGQTT